MVEREYPLRLMCEHRESLGEGEGEGEREGECECED